jgi:hydroxyacylglutathione hydrolase
VTITSVNDNSRRYEIRILPARTDNYAIFIIDRNSQSCVTIDTPCSRVIGDFLSEQNLTLRYILNTHHHPDHTGGNLELRERYHCEIIGHARDNARIPGVNILVNDGDMIEIFEQGLTANRL